MSEEITIIDYEGRYLPELLAISLPWLEENDILEPADMEQLEHPERTLASGGRIFLARVGDEIAGMMMLELFGNGVCEPFKFGVKEQYRNRGIGTALMERTLAAAEALGQHTLVLTSHHSLTAAIIGTQGAVALPVWGKVDKKKIGQAGIEIGRAHV